MTTTTRRYSHDIDGLPECPCGNLLVLDHDDHWCPSCGDTFPIDFGQADQMDEETAALDAATLELGV